MIHTFTATNFYSVEGTIEINFLVDKPSGPHGGYIKTKAGSNLSLIELLIGPNASGKTTALRAIAVVQWLITSSFRTHRARLPVAGFAGNGDKDRPCELEVVFEIDGTIHKYYIVLTDRKILKEALYVKTPSKVRNTYKKVFIRSYSEELGAYSIDDSGFGLKEGYWKNKQLGDSSIIAASSRFGNDYALKVVQYWEKVECSGVGMKMPRYYYDAPYGYRYRRMRSEEDLLKDLESDVKMYADLGIDKLGKNDSIFHRYGDVTFELDIDDESQGTQKFMQHTTMMSRALREGGMVVVDEFDAYLHSNMFISLVKKFANPKINKAGAQLLLTSHNLLILDHLNRDQIVFASKNHRGSTCTFRLDEKKNVRTNENYLAKYLKGAYGALPLIAENID